MHNQGSRIRYKIFQPYYDENQIGDIEPQFFAFDNTENKLHEPREYHVFKLALNHQCTKGIDAWGMWPWRCGAKSRYPAKTVIELIDSNPDADVHYFSSYFVAKRWLWFEYPKCSDNFVAELSNLDEEAAAIYLNTANGPRVSNQHSVLQNHWHSPGGCIWNRMSSCLHSTIYTSPGTIISRDVL